MRVSQPTTRSRLEHRLASTVQGVAVGSAAIFLQIGPPFVGAVDVYDSGTREWRSLPLATPRSPHVLASVGDRALVLGGIHPAAPSGVVDRYDAATGQWTTTPLSEARERPTSAVLGRLAFFAGGTRTSAAVDVYDAAQNAWSGTRLTQGRRGMVALAAGAAAVRGG